jgi:hypothetical protein
MEDQLSSGWEDAWICFEAALICFSSFRSSADYLATKHPMDVSSLAGRVISSLRPSTRIHPITGWPSLLPSSLPVPPTACLTVSLPKGRRHGVTTFHVSDSEYLRSTLLYRWGCCPCRTFTNPSEPPTYRFGSSLTAPLACQSSRQLQVFTYVDLSILS